MTSTEVFCTIYVEGIHFWKDCPLEEVAYLRHPHRHVFRVIAYKDVTHNDRDVEFIVLKHAITEYFNTKYYDEVQKLHVFGGMSCEMIATELIHQFDLSKCSVDEDSENGALVCR